MPGMVIGVSVKVGESVSKGQKLLSLEAMKMETMINADRDGEITQLLVQSGSQVETGDLLLVLK
jgi:pyruvate carboxylase